jgi:hypothetical protein
MKALVALLAVLLLTACGGWEGKGVITEKTHSAPYSWTQMICASFNAQGVCTVWVPVIHQVPEAWGFKVRDRGGDIHDVEADKKTWDAAKPGDKYDNTP